MMPQQLGLVARTDLEVGDALHQVAVLLLDLLALQAGQVRRRMSRMAWACSSLRLEPLHQAGAGRLGILAGPDDADDLVEVVEGDQQALQDVGPLLGLVQLEAGAPDDDVLLVVEVVAEHLAQRQGAGHPVDQGQHVDAEGGLHGVCL